MAALVVDREVMGKVVEIYISPTAGTDPYAVPEAVLEAGRGILA